MRRAFIGAAAFAALAMTITPTVQAQAPRDRATGGGQILLNGGAGSTIAFTAQGTSDDAKGQVQWIDREAGTGQNQVKGHGVVDCIVVDGDMAFIEGDWKRAPGSDPRFKLYVQDVSEPNQGADMIEIMDSDADSNCDFDPDDPPALGRGNAQVHDGDASNTNTNA